ncbi:MAG: malto-oligosyltrehalose trehalohydrolase [Verrucomicrobiota bacterium]
MPSDIVLPHSCRPVHDASGTTWRVWAPHAKEVRLDLFPEGGPGQNILMENQSDGHFQIQIDSAENGLRYGFSLDGGPTRPDPCSLWQPDGVHEPSALYFPSQFSWQNENPLLRREDIVLYELHIGTFTDIGTFGAAIERLPDLVDLGVNAIELLPVAQCPGSRNWGYDDVFPFATQNNYGGPGGLQQFIDAAHGHGLAIFLDVVFNHLGPEGNYLSEFAPYYSKDHPTPWGLGFRFEGKDSGPVRDYFLDCVYHWIHDFRFDGLRLDAVHAMVDRSSPHILTEIKMVADIAARERGGQSIIIAESLLNDPDMVTSTENGGLGLDAEWNEDFHHAVFSRLASETSGKYTDYAHDTAIEAVFRDSHFLTGQFSHYYGKPWGKPAGHIDPTRFVISLQNHDHIGNRARGERIASLVSVDQVRLGACLTVLSPCVPMLFMGEEYGETNPFLFFTDFSDPRAIDGVRKGRKRDYALSGEIPDPQAVETHRKSCLSWDWSSDERASLRHLYRDLIRLRSSHASLREGRNREVSSRTSGKGFLLIVKRGDLTCWFHFADAETALPEDEILWRSNPDSVDQKTIAPWETVITSNSSY